MITIAPSILSADFARLGEELRAIEAAGADMAHIDVMDGVFVPNISLGMPVVAAARKACGIFFDVHLMIANPQKYIADFAKAGSDSLTFHCEAAGNPAETIDMIHAAGIRAGVSIKPDTPAETVFPLLDKLDLVLVMTVEPGFGGQAFRPEQCAKVREIYNEAQRIGREDLSIQVDGGIAASTIAVAAAAGADCFVAGSAVYGKPDYAAAIAALRAAATAAYPAKEAAV